MARIPSQKSIDLYNQLVAKQNKVRSQLRKIHKNAEEALGAGRLPAIVIPKSAHKIKRSYFEGLSPKELQRRLNIFRAKVRQAKELFAKGLQSYLGKTVKDGYLELWRDQIKDFSGEDPVGFVGRDGIARMYSKEQIEKSPYGDFMKTYNRLFRLSPEGFLALLYTGKMISFKYIYEEMKSTRAGSGYSWLDQQNDILNTASVDMGMSPKEFLHMLSSSKAIKKAYETATSEDDEERFSKAHETGRGHKASTYAKARERAGKK